MLATLPPNLPVERLVIFHGEVFNTCLSQVKIDYSEEKKPDITCTSKEEKTMAVYQAVQERLLFLLWGKSDGSQKLKPCLVYYSESPLALKQRTRAHFLFIADQIPKLGSQ
jgi:hypothetical protein